MRIKDGFALQELCDEHIIVAYGQKNIDFSHIISLNESATLLWKWAEGKDFDAEGMAGVLAQHYEVDKGTALQDVEQMLEKWNSLNLIEGYRICKES